MRNVVFLLVLMACVSHGRRTRTSSQQRHCSLFEDPYNLERKCWSLSVLASLFEVLHPVYAFNPAGSARHLVGNAFFTRPQTQIGCCVASMSISDELETSRRALLKTAALSTGLAPFLHTLQAFAADDNRPVLILGANGGTGRACVDYLLERGKACIASTRSGEFEGPTSSSLLRVAQCDVTSAESMAALIQPGKLAGVIYAASASRKKEAKSTSNAKMVDQRGVVECAKMCIASEVPRLILVSSGGVSKPSSAVYLFLNLAAGGIMDAKISGEDEMRRLYAAPSVVEKNIGYTIVRPGGLTLDPSLGVSALELNQGDDKSGRIARSDVAAICVESLASKAAFDTTFECYNADTAKGLNDVFASNAKKATDGALTAQSGRERRGDSWPKLFEGLQRDRVA